MALKLWVVGESNPDPETWSIWSEYSLVVAATKEEALALSEKHELSAVTEIPMDKPLYILTKSEPNWGDDI